MISVEKEKQYKMDQKKQKRQGCKYPDCINYQPDAKTYCCGGCAADHHDYIRLYGKKGKSKND